LISDDTTQKTEFVILPKFKGKKSPFPKGAKLNFRTKYAAAKSCKNSECKWVKGKKVDLKIKPKNRGWGVTSRLITNQGAIKITICYENEKIYKENLKKKDLKKNLKKLCQNFYWFKSVGSKYVIEVHFDENNVPHRITRK